GAPSEPEPVAARAWPGRLRTRFATRRLRAMQHAARRSHRLAWALFALAAGVAGGAVAFALLSPGKGFVEREEFRPLAPPEDVALWQSEWDRRAGPHVRVPDPPGDGSVVTERYWISRAAYPLEVRRRGRHVVVETHGIDEQVLGGGWSAFGEGTIEGDGQGFAGATVRFSWSCLGIRFLSATDGVARLV